MRSVLDEEGPQDHRGSLEERKLSAGPSDKEESDEKPWWSPGGLVGSRSSRAVGILTRAEKTSVQRRLGLVAFFLIFFAAVFASAGNYIFLSHTPEQAVKKYMTALQNGNYFAAVDRSTFVSQPKVLLKNSMYRAAQRRVDHFEVIAVQEQGDRAEATVQVEIAGGSQQIRLPLVHEHRPGLYNDFWRLDEVLQIDSNLQAQLPLDRITVNGSALRLKEAAAQQQEASFRWTLPLLPGQYNFSLPEDSYYALVAGQQTLTIGLTEQLLQPVTLELRPSQRMWQETNAAIDSWLNRCASAKSLAPTDCPGSKKYDNSGKALSQAGTSQARVSSGLATSSGTQAGADISNVRWRLKSKPFLWLLPDPNSTQTWQSSRYQPAIFELSYEVNGKQEKENIEAYIQSKTVSTGDTASIAVGLGQKP